VSTGRIVLNDVAAEQRQGLMDGLASSPVRLRGRRLGRGRSRRSGSRRWRLPHVASATASSAPGWRRASAGG
jgi:hypothetical protein